MPDLVAQGPRRQQRWRKRIPRGIGCELGRSAGTFSATWDELISRQHVTLVWDGRQLVVELLPEVKNPLFFAGEQVAHAILRLGEHFVIGETTFSLVDDSAAAEPKFSAEVTELTFSVQHLRRHRFGDPSAQLDILSRLPERIAAATTDEAIYEALVRIMFEGLSEAECVALCSMDPTGDHDVRFLYWDRTRSGDLQASRRLIEKAVSTGETVVHTWMQLPSPQTELYTVNEEATWAFATPFQGRSTRQWALYVSGGGDRPTAAVDSGPQRDELKFAEIVVSTVGSFVEVRELQRNQSVLGQFFSKPVISALATSEDPNDVLAPTEVEISALFCDLRGFSLATEQAQDDLLGLLRRVSDALGVLTHQILREGGVIGDFHGDAAMGFWGWPLSQPDAATRAARAAIEIRREIENGGTNFDFQIGMGIATGRAVAGKIGTVDQVKVTAFGPAVNLASRLEMLTKRFNTPILADSTTVQNLDRSAGIRSRRLVRVQPFGMSSVMDLWELLPPTAEFPLLTDADISNYEESLEQFIQGDWLAAWELLHRVPAGDRCKDFLTTYIASRNRQPPKDWDGVIRLESK